MDEHKIKVSDEQVQYHAGKKRIAFFNSFEEAAKADYEFYRQLSPEERLELHMRLSLKVHEASPVNENRRFTFDS